MTRFQIFTTTKEFAKHLVPRERTDLGDVLESISGNFALSSAEKVTVIIDLSDGTQETIVVQVKSAAKTGEEGIAPNGYEMLFRPIWKLYKKDTLTTTNIVKIKAEEAAKA